MLGEMRKKFTVHKFVKQVTEKVTEKWQESDGKDRFDFVDENAVNTSPNLEHTLVTSLKESFPKLSVQERSQCVQR